MVIFTGVGALQRSPPPTDHQRSILETSQRNVRHIQKHGLHARPIVVKFGGSSLSKGHLINRAAATIARECSKGKRVVVVVSAIGKTTDDLIGLTNGGTDMLETDRDDILAMGERTSARIFAASLKTLGIQTRYFDPSDKDWPILTNDNFSNATPLNQQSIARIQRHVSPLLHEGIVPVIGGFIGRTRGGRISTLGRGGSDTTALLLAKALNAEEVVLVTSAPGIMSGDPKLVKNPRLLRRIDIRSLIGMADSGTKFIHRKALRYKDPDIRIRVVALGKGDLRTPGTTITGEPFPVLDVEVHNPDRVMSLTLIGKNLPKNPAFAEHVVKIVRRNLLAVSEDSDSTILYLSDTTFADRLIQQLHKAVVNSRSGLALAVRRGMALIHVRGIGLEDTPGVIAKVSDALRSNNINIFGLLTITSSVIVLVDWKLRKQATRLIRTNLENN